MTPRRTAMLAGGAMLLVYVATLAPSVTFWDSGEFIAAARVLGIPHPPGTPLFVLLLNSWARALSFLPFATATNLFSAVCTAAAVALAAWWIARATSAPWFGLAGAVTAASMSSVWQNATETEVYAASLLLAIASIAAADVSGRSSDAKWKTLAAYLLALAIPLHLSALVAAPVVVYLASRRSDGEFDWRTAIALSGVAAFVIGVSRLSPPITIVAIAMIVGPAIALWAQRRRSGGPVWRANKFSVAMPRAGAMIGVTLVACSVLAFLVLRARHDPTINQGNPSTLADLVYVVGRQQYDVGGMWPRQAPVWLQIANWFEYADWQFALSLAPTVIPTIGRVGVTVAFAALALVGASWHRRTDRRTWFAVLLLLVCGSLGVVVYINLKAGTSFAWMFVEDPKHHEARDRDYFFVLGFFAWGLWAGMGAMALARRLRFPQLVGLVIAALPLVLNWTIVTRRAEPEASLPRTLASALLDPLPPNTVLFVAGDNDTYPLWFEQQVEGRRRDVTVITMPLLGAGWYLAELERRHHLLSAGRSNSLAGIGREIAESARAAGRPVAAALTVPKSERAELGGQWIAVGLVAISRSATAERPSDLDSTWTVIPVSRGPTEKARADIEKWRGAREVRPSPEPVSDYFFRVLSCPDLALRQPPSAAQLVSLDSLCNLR